MKKGKLHGPGNDPLWIKKGRKKVTFLSTYGKLFVSAVRFPTIQDVGGCARAELKTSPPTYDLYRGVSGRKNHGPAANHFL